MVRYNDAMLIIGHRGSKGTHPENSISSLREAVRSGADMVEFDVRVTRDGELVLSHDPDLQRTHGLPDNIRDLTLHELQRRTAGTNHPIATLRQALKECAGQIFLNIEVKRGQDVGKKTIALLTSEYKQYMDTVLISSFSARELRDIRKQSKRISLGLLTHISPFSFILYERSLHLSAVGFHRLHTPQLAIETAHRMHMLTYCYTVNRKDAIKELEKKGIDAVVTDYPAKFASMS